MIHRYDNLGLYIPGLLLLGSLLILALYHFFLYVQYKERIILYYCCYLFFLSVYIGLYLYADYLGSRFEDAFIFNAKEATNVAAIIFYCLFLADAIARGNGQFKWLFRIFDIVVVVGFIYCIFYVIAGVLHLNQYPVMTVLPWSVRILLLLLAVIAAPFLFPQKADRFVRMIKWGALIYLVMVILVVIAEFNKKGRLLHLDAMQWFFIGTLIDILIFSIAMSYKVKELFTRVAEVRNRLSRDLHDEIGATLTGVTMMSEFVKKKLDTNAQEGVGVYVDRITAESKLMSEKLNDIVWATNPDNDSTEKIMFKIQSYAMGVCVARNIQFHISSLSSSPETSFSITARNNLYNISKEAINNAAKYSGAKNIYFNLEKKQGQVIVTITDDGIGFDHDLAVNGNGLRNMRTRAKEINATFQLRSGQGKGTQIELRLS